MRSFHADSYARGCIVRQWQIPSPVIAAAHRGDGFCGCSPAREQGDKSGGQRTNPSIKIRCVRRVADARQ